MNSILQQLFMIPAFRKALLEVNEHSGQSMPDEENWMHQLKLIFCGLMELEKQFFNTKKFVSSLKDIDGSPIDPRMQKDVDEFLIMLMDRVEGYMKGTKEELSVKNLF